MDYIFSLEARRPTGSPSLDEWSTGWWFLNWQRTKGASPAAGVTDVNSVEPSRDAVLAPGLGSSVSHLAFYYLSQDVCDLFTMTRSLSATSSASKLRIEWMLLQPRSSCYTLRKQGCWSDCEFYDKCQRNSLSSAWISFWQLPLIGE